VHPVRHSTYISFTESKRRLKVLLFVLFLLLLISADAFAQKTTGVADYDEEPVELWHKNIGSMTINAVLAGTTAYIQPTDIFNLARVRTDISADKKIISGYFIEETRIYKIDLENRMITYKDDKYPIGKDQIIETVSGIYLRCDIFEKVFNLKCTFNFSELSIELQAGEPLPAESEAAAAKNREHLQQLGDNFIPDRRIPLSRSIFSVGTLDYQGGVTYSQSTKLNPPQYGAIFGGQLLGGDFDGTLTMSQNQKLDWKTIPVQWRTGIENSDLISQIIIGKRATFSNLSLPDSMVGMQISNAQTGYKSSFSNYTISDRTEPNWTVELYINDVLINYVKADQTGYYKFVIPLSYGSTNVLLKFHGPYGEVRTQIVQLRIPYTFLPPGHVEYTAMAGTTLSHPSLQNSLGKLDLKLGISTFMTGGGGLLYQHDEFGKAYYSPYGTTSIRMTSGILVGAEYYHGTGYRTSMNITGPVGLSMDAEYDQALTGGLGIPGQTISNQRKIQLNAPLPFLPGSIRLSAVDVPENADTGIVAFSAQTLVSFFGASLDLSANYGLLRSKFKFYQNGTEATGSAGLSLSFFDGFMVHPSANLDYSTRKVTDMQVMISKALGSLASFSMTGGYSFVTHSRQIQADVRMNLPYAQIGASGSGGTGQPYQGSGTIQGSLGFDPHTTSFVPTNHPVVRRGGILVEPFLDLNNDGIRQDNEPIVKHFGFEQDPGKVIVGNDGTLRVMDMEPYRKYIVKTTTADVENIAWVPKFSSFEITPPANGYALVEIPVTVAGQIEGYIYETGYKPGEERALGGARIKIQHRDTADSSEIVFKEDLLSYSNGEFYYMGIAPGKYRAYVDPKQLALLHYISVPAYIDFEILNKEEGDSREGLNFTLKGGPSSPATPPSGLVKALK
jgi:hypothetical protein